MESAGLSNPPPRSKSRPESIAALSRPRYIQQREENMPEPGYNDGEPPSLIVLICGTAVVVLLFAIIKSCVW